MVSGQDGLTEGWSFKRGVAVFVSGQGDSHNGVQVSLSQTHLSQGDWQTQTFVEASHGFQLGHFPVVGVEDHNPEGHDRSMKVLSLPLDGSRAVIKGVGMGGVEVKIRLVDQVGGVGGGDQDAEGFFSVAVEGLPGRGGKENGG